MKISVIIPTFNRAYCLERAIESVLSQSYENFDLWIVDDGSTDDTQVILQKYINHPKVNILKQSNGGVSSARNLAVKHSDGNWVSFLDSDDEWHENKLSKQVELLKSRPELKLIHGEEIWVRKGKRVNPKFKHKKSGGDIFKSCLKLCLISPSAVMIRRDLYNEHCGFDNDFIVCEDYDLWLKITLENEVGFVEDPIITKHGGHEDQLSAKYKAMDYFRVWSMMRLNERKTIPEDKREALLDEVITKSEILIKGYKKHNNLENLPKVESWLEIATNLRKSL